MPLVLLVCVAASCQSRRDAIPGAPLNDHLSSLVALANNVYADSEGRKASSDDPAVVKSWVQFITEDLSDGWTGHTNSASSGTRDARVLFGRNTMGVGGFFLYGTILETHWQTDTGVVYYQRGLSGNQVRKLHRILKKTEQSSRHVPK